MCSLRIGRGKSISKILLGMCREVGAIFLGNLNAQSRHGAILEVLLNCW